MPSGESLNTRKKDGLKSIDKAFLFLCCALLFSLLKLTVDTVKAGSACSGGIHKHIKMYSMYHPTANEQTATHS